VQFDRPIATFQAVGHRCADAYIDVEALRLTCQQALWRLDADLSPTEVDEALDVATFWACESGHRVVHAAQHLHGGIGVDIDYPIHRYYRWARSAELLLGGATAAARSLGAALAAVDAGQQA
jgi:3-oxocholest-4-en-26-oyl-CoA dehydrogenase beta subunit